MSNPRTTLILRRWFHAGGSALPAIRALIKDGDPDQAAVIARIALRDAEEAERQKLFEVLGELTSAPSGWAAALEDFARDASDQRWDELMRFVPEEIFYQRLKYTVLSLLALGCDGDVLFRCVSRTGMMPELFDLAESGSVDPETIVTRASGSPAEGAWLGLAALAAFARNDREATVRHLWRASQLDAILSFASITQIRERGDEELNAALDQAGVPRDLGDVRRGRTER